MSGTSILEDKRLLIQKELDAAKTLHERNISGQFATPTKLAHDILKYARNLFPKKQKIRFIDPALGTGAFYSALLDTFPSSQVERAAGFEIDRNIVKTAKKIWTGTPIRIFNQDFTKAAPKDSDRVNLIICNPPYVRHHHLLNGEKVRLQKIIHNELDIQLSGLTGYYCYFLLLSIKWMEDNGIAGWLIPSEFMDVNYGMPIKLFLTKQVQLLHAHRFNPEDVQFDDALVSSTVLWFRKCKPDNTHKVKFSFGGTLLKPKVSKLVSLNTLKKERKWTRIPFSKLRSKRSTITLGDFFNIRRGIATGHNSFFILTKEQVQDKKLPMETFRPILPSPRYLPEKEIRADENGEPISQNKLYLLDCSLPEEEVKQKYPSLWAYMREGIKKGVTDRYLCKHRSPWYSQETRPPSPFYCTYIGRKNNGKRPFRFILNHSNATVTNSYLILYPKLELSNAIGSNPEVAVEIWKVLNSIPLDELIGEGRVYGGGLYKIEPRELEKVSGDLITGDFIKCKSQPRTGQSAPLRSPQATRRGEGTSPA